MVFVETRGFSPQTLRSSLVYWHSFFVVGHLAVLEGPEEPSAPHRKATQRILGLEEAEGAPVLLLRVRDENTSGPYPVFPLTSWRPQVL